MVRQSYPRYWISSGGTPRQQIYPCPGFLQCSLCRDWSRGMEGLKNRIAEEKRPRMMTPGRMEWHGRARDGSHAGLEEEWGGFHGFSLPQHTRFFLHEQIPSRSEWKGKKFSVAVHALRFHFIDVQCAHVRLCCQIVQKGTQVYHIPWRSNNSFLKSIHSVLSIRRATGGGTSVRASSEELSESIEQLKKHPHNSLRIRCLRPIQLEPTIRRRVVRTLIPTGPTSNTSTPYSFAWN